MAVSQKCLYALRAIFELALQYGNGSVRNSDIAAAQAIPARFLEVILSQLRRGGFIASRRGSKGGYVLLEEPSRLTVGRVIRFIEGPVTPVECFGADSEGICALKGGRAFMAMWQRAGKAISDVYDGTTFQDLLEEEQRLTAETFVPSFTI